MINGQSYAISIEHILRNVFRCDRLGFGGIVDSDFIRIQPFTAMACGFSFIYANAGKEKQSEIIKFIEDYSFYSKMSIDDLLAFDTSSSDNFNNGEEAIEAMIESFRKICR